MKIYTKTGDAGETSLFDKYAGVEGRRQGRCVRRGRRAERHARRRARRRTRRRPGQFALETIQKDLFAVGARLADPAKRIAGRVTKAAVQESDVERLEQTIDRLEGELEPLRRFILPGGALPGALLHVSRTICRRAERRVVALGPDAVEPIVIVYLNRLSDLLFVMARAANRRAGVAETEW